MSPEIKKYLTWAGLMVLGIVIDRKTGGKISGIVVKVPVVGPFLMS